MKTSLWLPVAAIIAASTMSACSETGKFSIPVHLTNPVEAKIATPKSEKPKVIVSSVETSAISWDASAVPNGFTRTASLKKCSNASAMLPLSRAGSVKTASHLAALIDQSLSNDPGGNAYISGTNMTPNMYMHSINRSRVRVVGVSALPVYLRSLVSKKMPQGQMFRMSRVEYRLDDKCVERYTVDVSKGYARMAHPGEQAWVDPNDSSIVFAGDCTNSPLDVVTVVSGVDMSPPALTSSTANNEPVVRVKRPDTYCIWVRVREDERGYLKLRVGSPTEGGDLIRTWQPNSIKWERGPKSGWYTKVCLTEADLVLAEKKKRNLFICNEKADVTLRRERDFPLLRSTPEFPKSDVATLGTGY